ncbi:MAG: hypothetical protein DME41_03180 [Verrucomicrobia bacterium]|nr:MAG: hypothetical protein DME41_03180 [Verrucomicrobiota bacterium]
MNPKLIRYAERIVAILLSATVLFLLIVRSTHAGGLWRDECDSLQLARLPTFADVLLNLKFTSFPILFPTTIRIFTNLFGASDASLRCFGFFVGAALLAVAWFNARSSHGGVPLILPALAGLNITFLTAGTWIRGYGLGSVLLTLAFGLTAIFVARPTIIRLVAMFVCYIVSMQCLYFDAALIPALLLAAFAVCILRRQFKWALALSVVAAICALSYVPKFLTYFEIRDWAVALQRPTSSIELWREFKLACGEPAPIPLFMWLAILSLSILGAAWKCGTRWRSESAPKLDLLLFGAFTIVLAVPMHFVFLWRLHNIPDPRYYVALLCLVAAAAELIIGFLCQFSWARIARLMVVLVLVGVLPVFAWPKITERETNLDLLAKGLQQYARADDLIIVNRWFLAPGFSWYYHGPARWMTLPELSEKRIHRYDLLRAKMESWDAISDIRSAISQTLQSGNRVWLVGGAQLAKENTPLVLAPAPDPQFGWDSGIYDFAWATQLGAFLQQHVMEGEIVLSPEKGISSNEDVPLLIARGWRD